MKFRPNIFVSCAQIAFTMVFTQFCPISKLTPKMSKNSQSDEMRLEMVKFFYANRSSATAMEKQAGKLI